LLQVLAVSQNYISLSFQTQQQNFIIKVSPANIYPPMLARLGRAGGPWQGLTAVSAAPQFFTFHF
jgi:hypothetical protein